MTEDRRYDEDEVAEIFAAATEARADAPARSGSGEGLTLPELEEIADEVGIAPELVRRAARRLDTERGGAVRARMGVPFAVGRSVDLPRALTDHEWQRLVVTLRDTFGATGKIDVSGDLRQWRNGNLRVLVEPTTAGHRLRMTTKKGDLGSLVAMGFSMLALALILLVAGTISGTVDAAASSFLGLAGLATLGASIARMPLWARTRARQMEEIAEEVTERTALPPAGGDRAPGSLPLR